MNKNEFKINDIIIFLLKNTPFKRKKQVLLKIFRFNNKQVQPSKNRILNVN